MNHDYFSLRLFDPLLTAEQKSEYLGRWTYDSVYRIQDKADVALALDKLATYRVFYAKGLAYPRILAVMHPTEIFPEAICLPDAAAAANWLRSAAHYPLFVKPARGDCGWRATLVTGREGDQLRLGDGRLIGIADLAAGHDPELWGALLFQERIVPHADLAARIGDRTATARLTVLYDRTVPEVWRASLRIPVGGNMVDTFGAGGTGNLLARIDRDSGRLEEVFSEIGIERQTTDVHPDTGGQLKDFVLPDWDAAVALVQDGSRAFPGLKINGWDVAFSNRGPLLVETNPECAYPQHANIRGMAEPRFLEMYPDGLF